jgi:hypothetical protein
MRLRRITTGRHVCTKALILVWTHTFQPNPRASVTRMFSACRASPLSLARSLDNFEPEHTPYVPNLRTSTHISPDANFRRITAWIAGGPSHALNRPFFPIRGRWGQVRNGTAHSRSKHPTPCFGLLVTAKISLRARRVSQISRARRRLVSHLLIRVSRYRKTCAGCKPLALAFRPLPFLGNFTPASNKVRN